MRISPDDEKSIVIKVVLPVPGLPMTTILEPP